MYICYNPVDKQRNVKPQKNPRKTVLFPPCRSPWPLFQFFQQSPKIRLCPDLSDTPLYLLVDSARRRRNGSSKPAWRAEIKPSMVDRRQSRGCYRHVGAATRWATLLRLAPQAVLANRKAWYSDVSPPPTYRFRQREREKHGGKEASGVEHACAMGGLKIVEIEKKGGTHRYSCYQHFRVKCRTVSQGTIETKVPPIITEWPLCAYCEGPPNGRFPFLCVCFLMFPEVYGWL